MFFSRAIISMTSMLMVLGLMFFIAGCGGDGGQSSRITITNTSASAPSAEGLVTIQADVTASAGIQSVIATVTKSDGTADPTPVTMTLQSGSTYWGGYHAPANTRDDGEAEIYTVRVTVTDSTNRSETSQAFTFEVPGREDDDDDANAIIITDERVVLPADFSGVGGEVTIRAEVTATAGVRSVYATVTRPDSTSQTVPMTLSGGRYQGTFNAPANTRADGQAETYSIVVTAVDNVDNEKSTDPFTFDVPALVLPPPPPSD